MTPALCAVIAASIFIASMVAMVCPAATSSPTATPMVTTPANRAAMWSGLVRSAFSAVGTMSAMLRSRTTTGRSWPLMMHITVRRPRSSGSEIASSPTMSWTPRSIWMRCSSPWRSPQKNWLALNPDVSPYSSRWASNSRVGPGTAGG
jgi:hypothetical protein